MGLIEDFKKLWNGLDDPTKDLSFHDPVELADYMSMTKFETNRLKRFKDQKEKQRIKREAIERDYINALSSSIDPHSSGGAGSAGYVGPATVGLPYHTITTNPFTLSYGTTWSGSSVSTTDTDPQRLANGKTVEKISDLFGDDLHKALADFKIGQVLHFTKATLRITQIADGDIWAYETETVSQATSDQHEHHKVDLTPIAGGLPFCIDCGVTIDKPSPSANLEDILKSLREEQSRRG